MRLRLTRQDRAHAQQSLDRCNSPAKGLTVRALLRCRQSFGVYHRVVELRPHYNVVPTDADIYPTKSYKDNALVQPGPRALFARLIGQGWIDAIRALHPDAKTYTFWDYMRNRWQRDAGLRLDHLLLNRIAANRLAKSGVDRDVRGVANAS